MSTLEVAAGLDSFEEFFDAPASSVAILSVWLGVHVMFRRVADQHLGVVRVPGLPKTLAASAALGAAWKLPVVTWGRRLGRVTRLST